MSSTPITTPVKVSTPTAPVKATKANKKESKQKEEPKQKVKKEGPKEKAKKEEEPKEEAKKEEPKEEAKTQEQPPTEKKQRAVGLPAKYGKFIQYSYYLIRAINNHALEANGAVLIDEDQFIAAAHIFDSIDIQQGFVNAFLENKNIAKEMRTHVADKKKAEIAAAKNAEKAVKEAAKNAEKAVKEAAKNAEKAAKEVAKNAEKLAKAEAKKAAKPPKLPKTTAPKAKSKKATAAEPDLVTSLVALANSTVDSAPTLPDSANRPAATAENQEEEEEEELDVRLITIHGKDYLIDESNNLYDCNTHAVVGTWDKDKDIIVQP